MKASLSVLYISLMASGAFGQGLVNFHNTSTTLVSAGLSGGSSVINGSPGAYYFGLLIAPSGFSGPLSFSGDARFLLCGDGKALRLWELEWDWEFPDQTDWDDDATPLLEFFLTRSRPYEMCGLNGTRTAVRKGAPRWDQRAFESLLKELSLRGYGWLRSGGIRRKLDEFTRMI